MKVLNVVLERLHELYEASEAVSPADGGVMLVQTVSREIVSTGRVEEAGAGELTVHHNLQLKPGDRLALVTAESKIATEVLWTKSDENGSYSRVRILPPACP